MSVALELLENLDINEILKISGFIDELTLNKLIEKLQFQDFSGVNDIIEAIENLDGRNFIRQILSILPNLNIESNKKISLLAFFGDIDYRISQGADEKIQLSALLAQLMRFTKKKA